MTIRTLPALVRNWWIQSDRDISAFVEKYASSLGYSFSSHRRDSDVDHIFRHISKFMKPAILRSELEQILDYKSDSEKFHIIAFANSSDVVAVFKEDEASIRLSLSIPPNYPLKSVEVSFERKMGMSENNWRKWIFSMNSLLMTQDASILEAILSWKSSMMKKFEGMEPCYICYGIFHVSNSSTPNLTCKTCKNKFHAACLVNPFTQSQPFLFRWTKDSDLFLSCLHTHSTNGSTHRTRAIAHCVKRRGWDDENFPPLLFNRSGRYSSL